MRAILFNLMVIPLLSSVCFTSQAQSGKGQETKDQSSSLKSLMNSKNYIFHPLSATSMKGRTVQLTSEYYLRVNSDSLQVDLPYYGRSYSTAYPANSDMGVKFNTVAFTYQSDSSKNGGWEISIKPKNESSASMIYLSVSSSGYCTVRINSNNRNPITYYGNITGYESR